MNEKCRSLSIYITFKISCCRMCCTALEGVWGPYEGAYENRSSQFGSSRSCCSTKNGTEEGGASRNIQEVGSLGACLLWSASSCDRPCVVNISSCLLQKWTLWPAQRSDFRVDKLGLVTTLVLTQITNSLNTIRYAKKEIKTNSRTWHRMN